MTIGITGAVTALGDTLFPATSLRTSFAHDFSSNSPALLRFRLVHPVVAVVAGIYIAWIIFENASRRGGLSAAGRAVVILLLAQVAIGILNVILLTPIWLQIIHLCVADVLWVVLVLVSADLVFESSVVRSNPSLVRTPAMR
ncbi:MAG: COX15/CtaA family protein [Acidobacteria bacterium]|nr:COX15/CtaA family protein [Acidobacteriota bacterium]